MFIKIFSNIHVLYNCECFISLRKSVKVLNRLFQVADKQTSYTEVCRKDDRVSAGFAYNTV